MARRPRTWLSSTEVKIYGAFCVMLLGGAIGYGLWSGWEPAGTALLFIVPLLFAIIAGYLWFEERLGRVTEDGDDVEVVEAEEPYLPHASIWPLEVGAGIALAFSGLAMGRWVLIPGLVLFVHGLGGWIVQSRRRDLH